MSEERILSGSMSRHRHQTVHGIVSVKAEQLCYGSYGMCGIRVSAVMAALLIESLPAGHGLMAEEVAPVVYIRSLAMCDDAQGPCLGKREGGKVKPVVTTVFGHETMSARTFRHFHHAATVVDSGGKRHLHRHMLSALHGLDGNRSMGVPVGTDIYQVHIRLPADLTPGLLTGEGPRQMPSGKGKLLVGTLHRPGIDIRQTGDFTPFDIGIALEGLDATVSQTYHANTHDRQRFTTQLIYCSFPHNVQK